MFPLPNVLPPDQTQVYTVYGQYLLSSCVFSIWVSVVWGYLVSLSKSLRPASRFAGLPEAVQILHDELAEVKKACRPIVSGKVFVEGVPFWVAKDDQKETVAMFGCVPLFRDKSAHSLKCYQLREAAWR